MMAFFPSQFVAAASVRQTLVPRGDVRSDVAFQNDINALLAEIEEEPIPFQPLASLTSYSVGWLEEGAPMASDDWLSNVPQPAADDQLA
jgi:hypothetical protein